MWSITADVEIILRDLKFWNNNKNNKSKKQSIWCYYRCGKENKMSGGGRVPVASSLLSRSMANLDQNERNEALSMLITVGLSHYQQNYGNSPVDMNSLKRLHGKIKPLLPATKIVTIFYSVQSPQAVVAAFLFPLATLLSCTFIIFNADYLFL